MCSGVLAEYENEIEASSLNYIICFRVSGVSDLDALHTSLQEIHREMTRWDVYEAEVNSGHLQWSIVHTEKFFKENAKLMEGKDGNFDLVRVRLRIMMLCCTESEKRVDLTILSVASSSVISSMGEKRRCGVLQPAKMKTSQRLLVTILASSSATTRMAGRLPNDLECEVSLWRSSNTITPNFNTRLCSAYRRCWFRTGRCVKAAMKRSIAASPFSSRRNADFAHLSSFSISSSRPLVDKLKIYVQKLLKEATVSLSPHFSSVLQSVHLPTSAFVCSVISYAFAQ